MALSLNGTSQFVFLGLNLPFLNNVASAAIMGRIRVTKSNQSADFFAIAVGPPPGTVTTTRISLSISAGNLSGTARALDGDGPSSIDDPVNAPVGRWIHTAFVVNHATRFGVLYIDGVIVTQGILNDMTAGNTSATNSKCATIGAQDNGASPFFAGDVEDFRIYEDRVLGPDEVGTIAAGNGRDGITRGLKARWLLNEGGEDMVATRLYSIAEAYRSSEGQPTNSPQYIGGLLGKRPSRRF